MKTAIHPVPHNQGASLNCYNFQKLKLFLCLKFKSAADTGTEHHISAQLVANGRWEESSLTLWLQFRPCLLSSPPDQSLPSAFPPKSLVCRLHQARMGMDQCLRAPPAELISIPSSRPLLLLLLLSQQAGADAPFYFSKYLSYLNMDNWYSYFSTEKGLLHFKSYTF